MPRVETSIGMGSPPQSLPDLGGAPAGAPGVAATAVVDLRCLQDPNYVRRGVGRFALALLRHAPAGLRLVGLVDPALPPLFDEARPLFDAIFTSAYAFEQASRSSSDRVCFISLSPMTHDPLFGARLLAICRHPRCNWPTQARCVGSSGTISSPGTPTARPRIFAGCSGLRPAISQ